MWHSAPIATDPSLLGKRVAVIGGGNSGIEAAIDLAAICEHVDVFEFLDELKADMVLQKRLTEFDNVAVHLSSAAEEVIGNGTKVTGIKVKDRKSGESALYDLDGVFVQIGLTANSSPFSNQFLGQQSRRDYNEGCWTHLSIPGVYAAKAA